MKILPVYAWTKSLRKMQHRRNNFLNQPWAQGGILLLCVVVAMLFANLPFTKDLYHNILHTHLSLSIQTHDTTIFFPKDMSVEKFINDILMVVFFFLVGLEIKQEIVHGELSSPKKAMMPIIAALGGVVVPALIYIIINKGTMAESGWGIPTATDIAFAIGILSILSNKVPMSLKVFLTALAIVDDLVAILVVAFFYGEAINLILLSCAFGVIALVLIMKNLGEKRPWFYFIPAIGVWVLFYYSGIHATMAGVVMAFLIPMQARYSRPYFNHKNIQSNKHIAQADSHQEAGGFPNADQRHSLKELSYTANNTIPLSHRLEHALAPWVNYFIMPVFALANAGVVIDNIADFNIFQFNPELGSVSLGIFLGLVLGKPIGITLASYIAIKAKIGAMPHKANWKMIFAVACLGGIGFTMSIFVDTLSFGDYPEFAEKLRNMGKIAVLLASLASGIMGSILINLFHKTKTGQV